MSINLNISCYMIEGVVMPSSDARCSSWNQNLKPNLRSQEKECSEQIYQTLYNDFDKHNDAEKPTYWKTKLIVYFMINPELISMSVIPTKPEVTTLLFGQKNWKQGETKGFIAPYLTEEEQKKWGADSEFKDLKVIAPVSVIEGVLQDIDISLFEKFKTCLEYFIKDPLSSALTLTYLDTNGELKTRSWTKT